MKKEMIGFFITSILIHTTKIASNSILSGTVQIFMSSWLFRHLELSNLSTHDNSIDQGGNQFLPSGEGNFLFSTKEKYITQQPILDYT